MTSINEHVCKNCNNTFTESFCNKCGQKEANRITTSHVAHDLLHVFVHADKGVFTFMSRVVFYPGIIARDFVEGKRKIFNPFQYLIFAVGFILFLMAQSHFYEELENYNAETTSKLPSYFKTGMQDFYAFVKKQGNIITFFTIPVYALFSWLCFKKREHNYPEHFTIIVFAMCQTYTLNAFLLLALMIFNVSTLSTATLSLLLMLFSFSLTYKQFYKLSWLTATWKGIVVFMTAYVVQVSILMIGAMIYIFLFKR
ncbi:MAG TPA: hypothetical protein VF622_05150 [Segetibacter sp.]|jgi:hypothetical protein